MKRTLTLIAAIALVAFAVQAECSGSTCVGHKGKFERMPTVQQVQS